MKILVIGGGCFGSSSAVELAARGHSVTVVDRVKDEVSGAVSANRVSAVHDDNKIVRLDYASDALYTRLSWLTMHDASVCGAVPTWAAWPVFHRTGIVVLEDASVAAAANDGVPASFGAESFACLRALNFAAVRPAPPPLLAAFDTARWCDGYLQPDGGWGHPKRAVEDLLRKAEAELGVAIVNEHVERLVVDAAARVVGVLTDAGRSLDGFDHVVVAAGSRTPRLLPHLSAFFTARAMPVVHFRPRPQDEEMLRQMPVWAAGIRQTGYYGFPLHPESGMCKVGWHGQGWDFPSADVSYDALAALHAIVKDAVELRFRDFLRTTVPALADAVEVKSRLCLYCDSRDSDFVIDRDAAYANLTVVSGGSGHGFKFLPAIGALAANVVEGVAPHAKLAESQLRFGRLAERLRQQLDALDSCRTSGTASDARAEQVREAIQRAQQLQR